MIAEVFSGFGWWLAFPIIGLVFMLLMMSRMFGSRGRGSKGGMGPMGMMGGHGDDHKAADDSALEVLRKRYAAGELSDEEFDAKRRRLEGG